MAWSLSWMIWKWQIPKGKAYPAVLLDRDRLFVSAMGVTFCLDPWTGKVFWENELPGTGYGIATIAAVSGSTSQVRAAADEYQNRQSAAASNPAS